jgi:MYXO-CTERM domain-containing protein
VLLVVLSTAWADTCSAYGSPEAIGQVSGSVITEASGLAASRTRDGVFFTHGDTGDPTILVAFRADGTLEGEHTVVDAENEDWEDIVAAPCPDEGDCLYIGDIGDNDENREAITVWVVREPEAGDDRIRTIARYDAVYPDGPHDAETLLMQPCSGRLHVVTKDDDGLSTIYRFPAAPDDVATLEEVATVQLEGPTEESIEATGGDWDSDGDRVAIRTSDRVFEWVTDPNAPNAHWQDEPLVVVGAVEVQGEGLTYGPDGNLYGTGEGATIPLTRYACEDLGAVDPGECTFPQTGKKCGCSTVGEPGWWLLLVLSGLVVSRREGRRSRASGA